MLLEALGGRCAVCGTRRRLEFDHVDGCTWVQRREGRENRLRRYLAEFRSGVRLRVLCRSHNGSQNQHTHGTRRDRSRSDLIEEIEAEERDAA